MTVWIIITKLWTGCALQNTSVVKWSLGYCMSDCTEPDKLYDYRVVSGALTRQNGETKGARKSITKQ